MKKTLLTVAVLGCTLAAFAQGTVNFNNRVVGTTITHIYGPEPGNAGLKITGNTSGETPAGSAVYNGVLLAGTGFTAQLWGAGGAAVADSTTLSLAGGFSTTTFRTGAAAGWVAVSTDSAIIQGAPEGSAATLQIRVWDNVGGTITSWAQAVTSSPAWGASSLFHLAAGQTLGGNAPPASFGADAVSFNITSVPEPGTFILAGLGAAGLLIFRRRK